MKVVCDKNEFQKFIISAERNSSKNNSLPILSTILIKSGKNKLNIISTNLEVGFEAHISAVVEKDGSAAVPAKVLLPLLSSINDDKLNLESSGNTLKLFSKNSSSNLKCLSAEDFPILPRVKKDESFQIQAPELISALKNTLPATSNSHTKPELSSVYLFSQLKSPLTFIATDSFRLAENKVDVNTRPIGILIPQKSSQEIIRCFEDEDGLVDINFNKNQISLESKNIYFISRLTEGNFPDYQAILPKSFLTQVVADRSQLINSIKAASVFSSRLSEVILSINPKASILEARASYSDTGEHQSFAQVKTSGEPVQATFNYHYLLDALHTITHQKVFLGFNGEAKAVLLRGHEDTRYLHLVMPMKGV